jgi:hypothetical protein
MGVTGDAAWINHRFVGCGTQKGKESTSVGSFLFGVVLGDARELASEPRARFLHVAFILSRLPSLLAT